MFARLLVFGLSAAVVVVAYLPQQELTNSIYSSNDRIGNENESEDIMSESDLSSENGEEPSASPYKAKMTFRRRNINSGGPYVGSGPSPFSRMAYKAGYGSSRMNSNSMGRQSSNYFGNSKMAQRNSAYPSFNNNNNFGGNFGSERFGNGEDFSAIRANNYPSGLLSSQKNMGYFGSTQALRSNKNYKQRSFERMPGAGGGYSSANDLMSSFNSQSPNMNGGYQNRFPYSGSNSGTFIPRFPEAGRFPDSSGYPSPYESSYPPPFRGDMDPYNLQIATNQWNSKTARVTAKDNIILDVDGYADAKKTAKLVAKTAKVTKATRM